MLVSYRQIIGNDCKLAGHHNQGSSDHDKTIDNISPEMDQRSESKAGCCSSCFVKAGLKPTLESIWSYLEMSRKDMDMRKAFGRKTWQRAVAKVAESH